MKSGSLSSYRAAGALGDERDDDVPISRSQLIRHWWYVYLWTLQQGTHDLRQLNEVTKECEDRGIVKRGLPMPKDGADDLVAQVDDWKKRHGMK